MENSDFLVKNVGVKNINVKNFSAKNICVNILALKYLCYNFSAKNISVNKRGPQIIAPNTNIYPPNFCFPQLVIIFQRDELISKLFLFLSKSVVFVKMIKKYKKIKTEKKIFHAFFGRPAHRGTK